MEKKFRENSFTLDDYLVQFETMKKMGGIRDVLAMLPGMGGKFKIREEDIDEKKMLTMKAIIQSMTMKERENPSIINSSRKNRIAKGSGTSVQEVNRVLKQFEQTKMMM
jgi:signal recognition particle subunit SRP54